VTDAIRLVIPSERRFLPIARLVAGALAPKVDLTYDGLDDLEVAIETLLALRDDDGDLTLELSVGDRVLRAAVGPFPSEALRGLDEDDAELGLQRVLETVCDSFEREERDDGAWIELTKGSAA
jgi:hypothetical protein